MVMYNSLRSSGHARVHAGDVHGNVTYYINPDPSVEKAREPWPRGTWFLFIMPSLISLSHICIVYTQIVRGSWDITIRLRNVVPAASHPDLTATQQNPDCWRMLEVLDRLSTHDFSANGNGLIWVSSATRSTTYAELTGSRTRSMRTSQAASPWPKDRITNKCC